MTTKKIVKWSDKLTPEHKDLIIDLIGRHEKYSFIRVIFRIAMVQEGNIEKWATISFAEFDKKFGISRYSSWTTIKKALWQGILEKNHQDQTNKPGRKKMMYRIKIRNNSGDK
jgi:hypothetical protein